MALLPCSACARHVRANDVACPFCSEPIVAQGGVERVLVGSAGDRRFARAALAFLGASVLVAACGKVQGPPEVQDAQDATPPVDTNIVAVTAYGVPPMMVDAGTPVTADAAIETKDAGKDAGRGAGKK